MPSTSATLAASTKSMFDEQYSLSSSSSQFFMKMPTTSWPCCLSRCAVTAESTPPLRPTTMRCFSIGLALSQHRPSRCRRRVNSARRRLVAEFGQDLVRAQPRLVVEDLRGDHQLVGAGALDEGLDAGAHGVARADGGT